MKYAVLIVRQAVNDAEDIYEWLAERSPVGAVRWFEAFLNAVSSVKKDPFAFGFAHESKSLAREVRERTFRTPRGQPYRLLFEIAGPNVRVLRVRAPGQPSVVRDDIEA
jgi:plasmid stabilization system protein ParE